MVLLLKANERAYRMRMRNISNIEWRVDIHIQPPTETENVISYLLVLKQKDDIEMCVLIPRAFRREAGNGRGKWLAFFFFSLFSHQVSSS
jgi:hypothetical protein